MLLGDPNQLPQVSQGTHPEGAGASALEHLVGDARTIAPDRGLLLGTTYRLHPDVNAFISEAFYEGRLETAAGTERQRVDDGLPVGGTGIRHVPIEHDSASNRSPDEAAWIAEAVAGLVGRAWTDARGEERVLTADDVLVVAPYNAQVAEIDRAVKARLGRHANVGTVDKFQGREAPVAVYSMTTSSPGDAPRDLEFLYSGNRLNVAVSRARGLAVVLANPELLNVACHTPGADAPGQRAVPARGGGGDAGDPARRAEPRGRARDTCCRRACRGPRGHVVRRERRPADAPVPGSRAGRPASALIPIDPRPRPSHGIVGGHERCRARHPRPGSAGVGDAPGL